LVEHSRTIASIRNLDDQIGTSESHLETCSTAVNEAHRVLKIAVSFAKDKQKKLSDELAHLSQLKQQRNVLIGPSIVDNEQPAVGSTSANDGLVRQEPFSESFLLTLHSHRSGFTFDTNIRATEEEREGFSNFVSERTETLAQIPLIPFHILLSSSHSTSYSSSCASMFSCVSGFWVGSRSDI